MIKLWNINGEKIELEKAIIIKSILCDQGLNPSCFLVITYQDLFLASVPWQYGMHSCFMVSYLLYMFAERQGYYTAWVVCDEHFVVGWMSACGTAVRWGYSASVSLRNRWHVSVHPGIEPTLTDERALSSESRACKWSRRFRTAPSLRWNTDMASSAPFFPSPLCFPSSCSLSSCTVQNFVNQEFRRHRYGPHWDRRPTDQ